MVVNNWLSYAQGEYKEEKTKEALALLVLREPHLRSFVRLTPREKK